jgi:putative ABC transport system substrate-binding protein
MRRIGVLMGIEQNDLDAGPRANAFQQRLQDLGWSEGQLQIEYRWLSNDIQRQRTDAAGLAGSTPDLLVADTTAALIALRRVANDIPIVFLRVSDPVEAGFIDSLMRPGGNISGITNFEYAIGGKWLDLIKSIAPQTSLVSAMVFPGMAAHEGLLKSIQEAGANAGIKTQPVAVSEAADLQRAVISTAFESDAGMIVLPHALIEINRLMIIELVAQHRLPTIYPLRHYVGAGGLIAYGLEPLDLYRQAALFVDRVLKGAKLAELPVEQPTKYELVINLQTAKALGLTIPPSLLAHADEVIE